MNISIIISLIWTWLLIRSAWIDVGLNGPIGAFEKCNYWFAGMVTCGKCLGFVATLLLTLDIQAAAFVSILFAILSRITD